jgi:ATP-dependent helicase/nuclease subunit A
MRCGSVDYKSTPMEVGADYPENEGEAVMCLAKKYKGEKQLPEGVYTVVGHLNVLKDSKCFAEGRAVAELVENLVGTQYYDIKSGKLKSVDYGDIAILLRDANKDADKFSTELIRAGIPLSAPSKDSIGNYSEVALAINILQLIDCYNQDIPLASVLKSEIGKVSDSELLQIRKYTPKGSFVEAVKAYADSNQDELAQKLIQFEEFFNSCGTSSSLFLHNIRYSMPLVCFTVSQIREIPLGTDCSSVIGDEANPTVNFLRS